MHKVVTRECFHYRKLCDQPVVKEGEAAPEGNAVPYDLDVLAKGTGGGHCFARLRMCACLKLLHSQRTTLIVFLLPRTAEE